uniref:Uncharacterized protein n=1 Tax=Moniliophthora roreri TaxID=221103 RepID=A0A0W0F811_MONRR
MLLVQTQSLPSSPSLLNKLSSLSNFKSSPSSLYLTQMSPPHPPTPTRRSARQKLKRSTIVSTGEASPGSSARTIKVQRQPDVEEGPIASTSYSQPASPATKKRKSPPAVHRKRGRRKIQLDQVEAGAPAIRTLHVGSGKKGKRKQQVIESHSEPEPEAGPSNFGAISTTPLTPTPTPTRYFTRSRSQSATRSPRPYPYLPTPPSTRSRRKTPPTPIPSSLPAASSPPAGLPALSALSPQSSQSDLEAADLPGLASPPPSPSATPITRTVTRGRGRGRGTHVAPARSPVRTRRRAKLEEELESASSSDVEMDSMIGESKDKGKAKAEAEADNEEDEEMAVAADLQSQREDQQEQDENLAPCTPLPLLNLPTLADSDADSGQSSHLPELILPVHPQTPSTSPLSPTHSASPVQESETTRRMGAKARRYCPSTGLVWEQDRFGAWRVRGGIYGDAEGSGLWKGMWKARVGVLSTEIDIRSLETHNYISQFTSQQQQQQQQAQDDLDAEFIDEEMEWAFGHGVDSDDDEDDEDMDLDTDAEVQEEQVGQSTLDFSVDPPQSEDENTPPPLQSQPMFMEFQLTPSEPEPTSPPPLVQNQQQQQQQMPAANQIPKLSSIKLPELRLRDMDQFKDVFEQEVPPPMLYSSPEAIASKPTEGRSLRKNHYQSRVLGSIARGTPIIPGRRNSWTHPSPPTTFMWDERDGDMVSGMSLQCSPSPTTLSGYAGGEMTSLDMNTGSMAPMPQDSHGGYSQNAISTVSVDSNVNVLAASNTDQGENCGLTLPNSPSTNTNTSWQIEFFTDFANIVGAAGQDVPIDPALQGAVANANNNTTFGSVEPIQTSNQTNTTPSFGSDYSPIFDMNMPMNMFSEESSSAVPAPVPVSEFPHWTSSPSPEPPSPNPPFQQQQPFLEPRMGFQMVGAGSPPHSPPHSPSSPVGVVYS